MIKLRDLPTRVDEAHAVMLEETIGNLAAILGYYHGGARLLTLLEKLRGEMLLAESLRATRTGDEEVKEGEEDLSDDDEKPTTH